MCCGLVGDFFFGNFFIHHIVCSSQKQKNDAIATYPLLCSGVMKFQVSPKDKAQPGLRTA